jgi:nucleobase:cation symporter-1, NCS1 family
LIALALGIAPSVPGSLGTVAKSKFNVGPFWMGLYSYAWFVGFGVSFAVYAGLMMVFSRSGTKA